MTTHRKVIIATTLATIVTAGLYVSQMPNIHERATQPMRACVTEDDAGPCFWDASTQGNGIGQSFWVDATGDIHFEEQP